MIIEQLYDALLSAGAEEPKAREAARAVAEFQASSAEIKSTLRLHNWMLTYLVALTTAMAWKIFSL